MADIEWTEHALEDLEKLDRPIATRIVRKITWTARNFESVTPEPLSGGLTGLYKMRIGDWRVVYSLEETVIIIQAIGHRREIYRQ